MHFSLMAVQFRMSQITKQVFANPTTLDLTVLNNKQTTTFTAIKQNKLQKVLTCNIAKKLIEAGQTKRGTGIVKSGSSVISIKPKFITDLCNFSFDKMKRLCICTVCIFQIHHNVKSHMRTQLLTHRSYLLKPLRPHLM